MLAINKKNLRLYLLLFIAVSLNIACWLYSSTKYTKWTNVPPVPSTSGASISFLDDKALAFRSSGLALQNFGSVGQVQNLKDYNYETLAKWLFLLDVLDPHSNLGPFLAAYYFGAVQDEKKLPPIIHYLEDAGMRPGSGKWRWLAEAAYLARHRMKDMDEALRISRKLGSIYKPPMPIWTRNMEPMLRADMGDRQAAYLLMLEILKSNGSEMSNSEYTSTVIMICKTILTKQEALKNPLCQKPGN